MNNSEHRVYLLGHILQGMCARKKAHFGMVEEAMALTDAALAQIHGESDHSLGPKSAQGLVKGFGENILHEDFSQYGILRESKHKPTED